MRGKRDFDALPQPAEVSGGRLPVRLSGVRRGGERPVPDGCHQRGRRHAGKPGYPGVLRPGPAVCGEVPVPPGGQGGHPAVRPGWPGAPDPAGDRRPLRYQQVIRIAPRLM